MATRIVQGNVLDTQSYGADGAAADGAFAWDVSGLQAKSSGTGYKVTTPDGTLQLGNDGSYYYVIDGTAYPVSDMPDTQYSNRGKVTIPDMEPTAEGYEFVGWADASDGEVTHQPGEELYLTADKTLYAIWNKKGGGLGPKPEYDDCVDAPDVPVLYDCSKEEQQDYEYIYPDPYDRGQVIKTFLAPEACYKLTVSINQQTNDHISYDNSGLYTGGEDLPVPQLDCYELIGWAEEGSEVQQGELRIGRTDDSPRIQVDPRNVEIELTSESQIFTYSSYKTGARFRIKIPAYTELTSDKSQTIKYFLESSGQWGSTPYIMVDPSTGTAGVYKTSNQTPTDEMVFSNTYNKANYVVITKEALDSIARGQSAWVDIYSYLANSFKIGWGVGQWANFTNIADVNIVGSGLEEYFYKDGDATYKAMWIKDVR